LCSGATFNSNLHNCVLSSGSGSMTPLNNSIAIVKKALYYSNRLKELNEELTSVNQQMLDLSKEDDFKKREIEDYKKSLEKNKENEKMIDSLKEDYDRYKKLSEQNKKKDEIMANNKDVLMSDRDEIERMRRQDQTLNAAYEDGNIMVNANYLNYIVLLFVLVFFYHDKESNGIQGKMRNNQISTILFTLVMCALYLFYIKIYDSENIVKSAAYALIALIVVYMFTYNPYNITPKLTGTNLFTISFVIMFFITMILWYSNSSSVPTTLNETLNTFLMGSFSLIVSIGVIMLLLSSFGTFSKNKPSAGTYILNIMIIIGMLTIVYNLMDTSGVLKNNPVLKLLMNIVLYIPCLLSNILEYLMAEYYQTKYSSLILILIEIVLLIIYHFYPYIVSWLYTGDGILLINKPLSLNKEKILGYYETLSGNDQIELEKIKNPDKVKNGDIVEVRQTDNSTLFPGTIMNIRDTDGKYDVVYDDGRMEYNVLKNNIYVDAGVPLTIESVIQAKQNWLVATITNINIDDTYTIVYNYKNTPSDKNPMRENPMRDDNIDKSMVRLVNVINPNINAYRYSISFWLFINSTNENTNKYISLLNYSNNPNIMYNASTHDFIVSVIENKELPTTEDLKTIYSNKNVALQKWNNFVINYDSGTIDIFYNGELVSSTNQVLPNLVHHELKVGSPGGISAGICNLVYYRHPLDIITINNLYNLSKSTGVPNVPEMSLFSYNI
jgi:hypothetical protein